MALNARNIETPKNRAPAVEPGTYPARLVSVIDMGVQEQRAFQGKEKSPKQEINVTYELLDEFLKDENGEDRLDKPRWISETISLNSLDQERAKSTQRYYALDPDEKAQGDWVYLLGTPCMVTIVNEKDKRPGNNTIYEKVASVSSMRPKEAKNAPPLVNPSRFFDFDAPDVEVFNAFPEWLQNKIKGALNYKGSALAKLLGDEHLVEDSLRGDEEFLEEMETNDQAEW